jgi:hypothetical protein
MHDNFDTNMHAYINKFVHIDVHVDNHAIQAYLLTYIRYKHIYSYKHIYIQVDDIYSEELRSKKRLAFTAVSIHAYLHTYSHAHTCG